MRAQDEGSRGNPWYDIETVKWASKRLVAPTVLHVALWAHTGQSSCSIFDSSLVVRLWFTSWMFSIFHKCQRLNQCVRLTQFMSYRISLCRTRHWDETKCRRFRTPQWGFGLIKWCSHRIREHAIIFYHGLCWVIPVPSYSHKHSWSSLLKCIL